MEDVNPTAEPAGPMQANEQLPLVVAVDLGGTQIRTAVLRGAHLLSRVNLLTGDDPRPETIIPRLFLAVEEAVAQASVDISTIAGIGIGAPGPLNSHTGVVFSPPNLPGWNRVPLRDIFYERYHIPIYVGNDANVAALGEYMFGAGKGCNEMVYLTISTGIGGGVISNGKLLEGISGTAAELGHLTIDWRGERCNCGNIGCLERISSGTAIALQANRAIANGKGDELLAFTREHQEAPEQTFATSRENMPIYVDARTVALAAQAGIVVAQEVIATAAEGLGVGLVTIIHAYNPEKIILGGGVAQMGDLLLGPALRIMQERAMRVPREAVQILPAELGLNVGLVGAGSLIYYHRENTQNT